MPLDASCWGWDQCSGVLLPLLPARVASQEHLVGQCVDTGCWIKWIFHGLIEQGSSDVTLDSGVCELLAIISEMEMILKVFSVDSFSPGAFFSFPPTGNGTSVAYKGGKEKKFAAKHVFFNVTKKKDEDEEEDSTRKTLQVEP